MDSTLALGAFRIARGAGGEVGGEVGGEAAAKGGEAVDVNGNLVEREKGD